MNTPDWTIDSKRLQRVAETARRYVDESYFNSVEWRITHHQQVIDSGIYGLADSKKGIPLPDTPIYRIYSMTKPLVAIAAIRMLESGELMLPVPVSAYLPEFNSPKILGSDGSSTRPASQLMTVEHLFTHRAGLSYDFLPDCDVAKIYRQKMLMNQGELSLEDFVKVLAEQPLAYEPGQAWRYSYSIDVLARVLEVVRQQPLIDVLQEMVLQPCGMTNTGFKLSTDEQQRLLPSFGQQALEDCRVMQSGPHILEPLDVAASHPVASDNFARGGHGLYSTSDDYLKFMHVLQDGRTQSGETIISSPMLELMWQDRIPASQKPLSINGIVLGGYGWNLFGRLMQDPGQAAFLTLQGEGGWAGAASTYFWVDRRTRLSGLVMTQFLGSTLPIGDLVRAAAYQALTDSDMPQS